MDERRFDIEWEFTAKDSITGKVMSHLGGQEGDCSEDKTFDFIRFVKEEFLPVLEKRFEQADANREARKLKD